MDFSADVNLSDSYWQLSIEVPEAFEGTASAVPASTGCSTAEATMAPAAPALAWQQLLRFCTFFDVRTPGSSTPFMRNGQFAPWFLCFEKQIE